MTNNPFSFVGRRCSADTMSDEAEPSETHPLVTKHQEIKDGHGLESDIEYRHSMPNIRGSSESRSDKDNDNDGRDSAEGFLPQKWQKWLFPPGVPRSVQLMQIENIAVPACYLAVGVMQGLNRPLLNVYPLDLGATEAQQVTMSTLCIFPSTLKVVFGFLSDNVPLFGYRRKSYMAAGWLMASLSMLALIATSDLSIEYAVEIGKDGLEKVVTVIPENAPSIQMLSAFFLIFGTGYWVADVMADSIVAEKAKLEPEGSKGQLQSTCYICRFFGMMVAAPCSTYLYSSCGPMFIVSLLGFIPLMVLPFVCSFYEQKGVNVKNVKSQCKEIWSTVCSRSVWQPMGFVYLYNILQVSNAAWRQFLETILGFSANQLNVLLIVSYVLLYVGTVAYKYYFIKWNWRFVYIVGILINGVTSLLQVLLIYGITFGVSPFLFALGDDVVADLIVGIQFLPLSIMMVHLCPDGNEGASYAMFTTIHNSTLILTPAISTMLLRIWDVSKEALEAGYLSGMIRLTILTTLIQTSAVLFVGLLPRGRKELDSLNSQSFSGSKLGGFIFLSVIFMSILYSVYVGVLNIIRPGWAGES